MYSIKDLNELFPHLQLKDIQECICTKTYVFNHTVTFYKGEIYPVDLRKKPESNLIAVIQPEYPAYVGMDQQRFLDYFQMKEQILNQDYSYEEERDL